MANQDAWADFETLRHNLKSNKVEQLKQILTSFNDECHTNLTKTGKKQDLIDKITRELDQWRRSESVEYWLRAKAIMQRVRHNGYYAPRANGEPSYSQTHNYAPPPQPAVAYPPASSSSTPIARYDPYAPPRRAAAPVPPPATSSAPVPAPQPQPGIRFKYSPFFKVDRIISAIVECPESTSSMDRRSQSLSFSLQADVVAKLNSASPKYQLRLYCTSSTFYTPPGPFRSPIAAPCPIEFPPTCEVRVNGVQLTANLKGLKKKPGTAPPPDLGKATRLAFGQTNRVEMIYVNSQQPTSPKKYYLAVMLVETTSVDQLIDRLRKGKYKSKAEVLADMRKANIDDDEIVAGHQKMSLKCPLSYMRITTPCRSSSCVHPQCFDALSWFSVMEQTTTWMCPVCEKVLNVEDLIIDGYFDDILKHTPDSVEDVIVEADGQWHTDDNKHGSAEWTAAHPPTVKKPPSPAKRAPSPVKPAANGFDAKPRPSNAEIVILDSDEEDEDEGRVKRELSPSADSARLPRSSQSVSVSSSQPPRSQATDIIDLTLDSDDEEPPPRRTAVPLTKKRKEMDDLPSPTEQIWKKSRTDGGSSSSPAHDRLTSLVSDLLPPPLSSSQSRFNASHSSSSRASGSLPYASSSALPLPPSLPRRPSAPTHDNFRNTLPPLTSYAPRGSGGGGASPQNWR